MDNLAVIEANHQWIAPVTAVSVAVERYQEMLDFVKKVLREGVDFGKIPGVDKASLQKPGAEKLASFFGLRPEMILLEKTEDWDSGLFYYRYQCRLYREGHLVAAMEGSASSYESKYRYRWVREDDYPGDKSKAKTKGGRISEFAFAIEQAQTSGPYGKPPEYWDRFKTAIENETAVKVQRKTKKGMMDAWEIDGTLYRVQNEDMADIVNTVQKMAQKRAYVGTVIVATNASEYFTQDLEDMEYDHAVKVETLEEGRQRFMREVEDFYHDKDAIVDAFKRLELPAYSLERHKELRKALIVDAFKSQAQES